MKKSLKIFLVIVALLVALFVVIGLVGSKPAPVYFPAPDSSTATPTPEETVEPEAVIANGTCRDSGYGIWKADVTVKNTTDSPRTYIVTVSANDATGRRLGELNGLANAVAPGQTASIEPTGVIAKGKVVGCTVANVTSY